MRVVIKGKSITTDNRGEFLAAVNEDVDVLGDQWGLDYVKAVDVKVDETTGDVTVILEIGSSKVENETELKVLLTDLSSKANDGDSDIDTLNIMSAMDTSQGFQVSTADVTTTSAPPSSGASSLAVVASGIVTLMVLAL